MSSDQELLAAIDRSRIWLDSDDQIVYVPHKSILQNGPQCGLIALAMYCGCSEEETEQLVRHAAERGYTYNGEMFSARDMLELARSVAVRDEAELFSGRLDCREIVEFLLDGGAMLVPYDADFNHRPCRKNGHKAHWALVSGAIVGSEVHAIARHGKSRHLGIWELKDLADSNSQLNEFSPDRKLSGVEYKLPVGGISGEMGLKNKCVLLKRRRNAKEEQVTDR